MAINPMLDKEFLRQLDCMKHKEIYARLTSLTFLEMPIEQIEGRVTGGSINIDGSSASRRSCNITLVAQDVNINQFYWGLTHKFKVEIGIVNTINPKYDTIIWFNQGKFVITTFNVSLSANSYTITINGKDKMSLLNGDLGGNLTAQTDFASIDTYDNFYELKVFNDPSTYTAGQYYVYDAATDTYNLSLAPYNENQTYYQPSSTYKKEQLPLKTIIREAVHTYGREPYFNIIINDLEDKGIELLEYRGSDPLYLLLDKDQDVYTNMTLNSDIECHIEGDEQDYTLGTLPDNAFDTRVTPLKGETVPKTITFQNEKGYYVSKVEYGDTAGFRTTDLVYAGELIGNIGETLTSVLDKIKNMLGDFEYFYDINGRFTFQKQRVYTTQSWNNIKQTEDNDIMIENAATTSSVMYSFIDNNIVTTFNNTPNLGNLKNDYSIWGTRKGISGADIPVHLRYAIDKKPTFYKNFEGQIFATSNSELETIYEQIVHKAITEFYSFTRKENPHFAGKQKLPDDWWYMSDWYNYYRKITGEAPNITIPIGEFATNSHSVEGIKGYVEKFNPELYFTTQNTPYLSNIWLFHIYDNGVYRYTSSDCHNNRDVPRDLDGRMVAPFNGCGHRYDFFIDIDQNGVAYDKPGCTGFFYKPSFPQVDLDHIIEVVEKNSIAYIKEYIYEHYFVCDWREIIYQMSKDYFKHNQEDDFYSKVMLNNGRNKDGEYYYPNGTTGYEQYYTDINAFWRDLYDIDPEQDYYKQGGYYAESIQWANNSDDITFQKETVWVPYEENDAIFESDYYLPQESKKYSDETIEEMITIESMNIDLHPKVESNIRGITWNTPDNDLQYEVYRSFYAASGFCAVPLTNEITHIDNLYIYNENGVNSSSIGTEGTLKLYYRVRGYKDVEIIKPIFEDEEEETTENEQSESEYVRVYTQWSNKCCLEFKKEQEINDDGQVIGETVEVTNTYEFDLMPNEQIPMINLDTYSNNFVDKNDDRKYWNKKVFESPETLNFWFDFLDSDSELAQFAVPVVGDRPKAVNDSKVTSIYFKEIPNIIFTTADEYDPFDRQTGYTYIWLDSSLENMFSISAQQKSAKEALDEYLYQHAYCIENITINTLPIYYLEPNVRIFVYDEDSKINGEYIVSKITIPLAYNGTMSITANKAVNRIY